MKGHRRDHLMKQAIKPNWAWLRPAWNARTGPTPRALNNLVAPLSWDSTVR